MVPVAVSVPQDVDHFVARMTFDNWAFGSIPGEVRLDPR